MTSGLEGGGGGTALTRAQDGSWEAGVRGPQPAVLASGRRLWSVHRCIPCMHLLQPPHTSLASRKGKPSLKAVSAPLPGGAQSVSTTRRWGSPSAGPAAPPGCPA